MLGRLNYAFKWAGAVMSALAAYTASIFVLQEVYKTIVGKPMPGLAFFIVALPPIALGLLLRPKSTPRKDKYRVEVQLDPDLYHKMKVRMRTKRQVFMNRYIKGLIKEDTKGTQ